MNEFYRVYQPYFEWDPRKRGNKGGYSDAPVKMRLEDDVDGGDDWGLYPPSLLLSDSEEDDISIVEQTTPTRRRSLPLHQRTSLWNRDNDRPQVRFTAARVREHNVIVGDHPACCDCFPLSLDWKHGKERVYDINDYEDMRYGRSERGKLIRLDYWERRDILHKSGIEIHLEATTMAPRGDEGMEPSIEVNLNLDGNEGDIENDEEESYTEVPLSPFTQSQGASYNIEVPTEQLPQCNPFTMFEGVSWELFGDESCAGSSYAYPTMQVQILED